MRQIVAPLENRSELSTVVTIIQEISEGLAAEAGLSQESSKVPKPIQPELRPMSHKSLQHSSAISERTEGKRALQRLVTDLASRVSGSAMNNESEVDFG